MSLQNGTVAETRPAFDATFTQISMNHSEPGKRRPRRGGAVQWRCGPPIIVRSSGGGGFHTGTLRGHAPAAVTQESRLSLRSALTQAFVPAKMQAVPTRFVGWISHLLYVLPLPPESHLECRNRPSYQSVFPSGQKGGQGGCKFLARHRPDFATLLLLHSN